MKKQVFALMLSALCAASACAAGGQAADAANASQSVYRAAEHEIVSASDEHFTGAVHVQRVFPANAIAPYSGAYVTFEAGARSDWHSHPAGQHIIVTSGAALVGTRDGQVVRVGVGDTVWCPPGLDHWHGATPDAAVTHLVLTRVRDGQNVVWKEPVTDAQYRSQP